MKPEELAEHLNFAMELAHRVGDYLRPLSGSTEFREKGPGDVVTQADEVAQAMIFREIESRFPASQVLGEEGAPNPTWNRGLCWIVDPIDGTRNFIAGLPSFSISIGLVEAGEPVMGVVHDPLLGETFTAIRGTGATRNGVPISPSRTTQLGRSLLVYSLPPRVRPDHPEMRRVNRVVQQASTRRLGSAALNLCYVACGRLDGYWASTLSLWDIAAGILIAREAGCSIQGLDGAAYRLGDASFCVTATPELGAELLPLLQVT